MKGSLFASAERAISRVGGKASRKYPSWKGPVRTWDDGDNWSLFFDEVRDFGQVCGEVRIEVRPPHDAPGPDEEKAVYFSLKVGLWMPDEPLAAWSRRAESRTFEALDLSEMEVEELEREVEMWLEESLFSCLGDAERQLESLPVIADRRKHVMDSPWVEASPPD